jgi:hypothetical protein
MSVPTEHHTPSIKLTYKSTDTIIVEIGWPDGNTNFKAKAT